MRRTLLSAAAALFLISTPISSGHAAEQEFSVWLQELRAEAASQGISEATLEAALGKAQPNPKVIKFDRAQPEFTLTLQQYLDRMIPRSIKTQARDRHFENRELLKQISETYGVQSRFLVAFWGIETRFGRFTGGMNVINALATLAHDGRRSAFFRKQLLDALTILDEGHVTVDKMRGSWAGAMGQAQFMPSTFRAYATDHEGDGKIDIWGSKGDVFASAANYLSKIGWKSDENWGRKVSLPAEAVSDDLIGMDVKKPLAEWAAMGLRRADGSALPVADLEASLIVLDDGEGPAYLVYDNFRAILHWNRSLKFGVAVGTLADSIVGRS